MEKVVCYYHEDMDGIVSASIVKKVYPEAELIACQYGREFKQVKGKECVIMVDFSAEEKDMREIIKNNDNFCWIDHHKSAFEKLQDIWNDGSIGGLRKMTKSGCELTWDWFFPEEELPLLVALVGDYDMWKFNFVDTKPVGEYLPLIIQTPDDAVQYLDYKRMTGFSARGEVLLKAKDLRVAQAFAEGEECDMWCNPAQTAFMENCFVCNSNVDISNLGNYIAKQGYKIGIVWSVRDGKLIVNLRSIGDVDVSQIAKNWGGGGHKNASGFTLNNLTYLKKMLKVR